MIAMGDGKEKPINLRASPYGLRIETPAKETLVCNTRKLTQLSPIEVSRSGFFTYSSQSKFDQLSPACEAIPLGPR